MRDGDILILKGHEVISLLKGRELEIVAAVRQAYAAHAAGKSALPHSVFLRFPDERNRVIALPAYLGDGFEAAGVKWVSSFPGNLEKGLDRASAVLILNSPRTGRPEAIIEGSVVSAKRTAASAALAAQHLQGGARATTAGLVGCGLINFEVARFLLAACPEIDRLVIADLDPQRARLFQSKCQGLRAGLAVEIAPDARSLLRGCTLVSLATTAATPHIHDLSGCPPGSTILHVSLRDFAPEVILSCDNVVDDVDHVCRAQTSIHLAEQLMGHRDFVRCTLADVFMGHAPAKRDPQAVTIFSPFGLGVLDIAVARVLTTLAQDAECGTRITSFLPDSWAEASR
jgi:2,3-diaminopropionate biosynthesis protein SbnB